MDVGLDKMKKEEDATSFEFVDTDIKTEIVKEELMEADNIIKCEKCKDNSSSETDCQHHKNYRLGELDKKLDVPGLGKADHLQKNSIEDVKPKVENEECSSVSQQRKDPISKLVTGEITVKQEVPFDTPEYVSVGNDFLNSQAQQIKIEKEDIFCEDVKIETIKEEPLDDEAGLSPDMMIQDEDSSEDAMPGPSGGSKKDYATVQYTYRPYVMNETIQAAKKLFYCRHCGKSYTRASSLNVHQRIHDGEKPFECEVCFKAFTDRSNFRNHMKIHSSNGVKAFKCEVCSKLFSNELYLKRHGRIHNENRARPYKCKICSKTFSMGSCLKKHEKIHSPNRDKPFKCDICSKAFFSGYHLKMHKAIHVKKKTFYCTICSKSFSSKTYFGNHQKTHGNKNPS